MASEPSSQKRLVVQADDLGSSHAANAAIQGLFLRGAVTSTTLITLGPWARDALVWHRENPKFAVGLHLTHTSEWNAPRWRPLLDETNVPSLFDPEGYLWPSVDAPGAHGDPQHLLDESRAQLAFFLRYGIRPTHIDNHMFSLVHNDQNFENYLGFGKAADLPVLVPPWALWSEARQRSVSESAHAVVPHLLTLENGWEAVWDQLTPGLNLLVTHPVLDTPEIRRSIPGWEERFREYQLLSGIDLKLSARHAGVLLTDFAGGRYGD